MKKAIILAIAVAIVLVSYIAAYAQCAFTAEKAGSCGGSADGVTAASAKTEPWNDTCPVMGGEVDSKTPYKVAYKGKVIGLCCAGCVKPFSDDPEKYMKIIEEAEKD